MFKESTLLITGETGITQTTRMAILISLTYSRTIPETSEGEPLIGTTK